MDFLYEFTKISFMALAIVILLSFSIGLFLVVVDLIKPFILNPFYKKAYNRTTKVIAEMDKTISRYRSSEVTQDNPFNRVIYRKYKVLETFKVNNVKMMRVYKEP